MITHAIHLTYFHMSYSGVIYRSPEKLWYSSRTGGKYRQTIQQKRFPEAHTHTLTHINTASSSACHPLLLDHIHPQRPFAFDLSLPLPLISHLLSEDLLSITFNHL